MALPLLMRSCQYRSVKTTVPEVGGGVGVGVGVGVGPVVAGAWVGDGVGDGVGPVVAGASVGTAVPVDPQQNTDVVCEHEYADGSAEQPEPAQGRVHLGQLSECSLQY